MKILICPDSFKESLSAARTAKHIAKGILRVIPGATCKFLPMSDGGDGMLEAVLTAVEGHEVETSVHDPLMRIVKAKYGILDDTTTAVIEMAAASGLSLLRHDERNPLTASSYGTGELIRSALDRGCKKIILGVGGSATIDAGTGMAQALGVVFYDKAKKLAEKGGGSLRNITGIDLSALDPRIEKTAIIACYDVNNPLTGKQGAAYVYGPQKGASSENVRILDDQLRYFAGVIRDQLDIDVENMPGAGAAGGLGAGLKAFLNARLEPGFKQIAKLVDLESWIEWADLVITGEGKIDPQTSFGKAPVGVAALANGYSKPVIAFTAHIDRKWKPLPDNRFAAIIPVVDRPMTIHESMSEAVRMIENAAERMMKIMIVGKKTIR